MTDTPVADIKIGYITSQWAESNHLFVSYKSETTSTNLIAKEEAFEETLSEEFLCLYLADSQTAGKGRGKNTWTSPKIGSALLSSWSYLLGTKPQPTTSCLVGLALYRACTTTWPFLDWNLKAPNDIYIGDKKIAGILIENIAQGEHVRLIVGIGFNILSSPNEINTSTSLIENLPSGAPLLGQDYTAFLDRFLFELTDAVSHCDEPLSTTDQLALLGALNKHPLLPKPYTGMDELGNLQRDNEVISWMSL